MRFHSSGQVVTSVLAHFLKSFGNLRNDPDRVLDAYFLLCSLSTSGGVVAVMPGRLVATVWSPGLSEKGNSLAGTMALELLTTKTALSIF